MGFVLKKCFRDRAVTITKATGNKADALDKLRVFLDATEPQTVKFLVSLWGEQQTAITYKELRENILSGDISPEQLEKWRIDYSNLINEKLAPQWKKAMVSAAEELKRKYPKFLYNPQNEFAQEYIKERGAFLVTNIVEEQRNALKAATMHALNLDDAMTADNLSRILRPMIGLTKSQAISNTNYYNTVYSKALEAGASESKAVAKAREAATRYAHRQERERAFTIARTELASAYNHGAYGATKDAQSKGYIGDCKKTWLTADDERVCKICGGVDGESVNMDAKFSIGVDLPPAHPNCRCGVAYEEIFSSILTFDIINDIIDNDTFNILDSSGEIQPEWQGVDYISSYTKQQAIERLNSEYGITFKDLKKYSMDEILLNDCVGWLDSFYFQYSDFMTNSPAKLPLIKILSPDKLGDAPGMYEFNEKIAKVVGIFLNGKYYN